MEKCSGSSITITLSDGTVQTLEEIKDEESLREMAQEMSDENRYKLYRRPRIQTVSTHKDRVITRIYNRREVATLNWERRKMEITQNNVTQAICELFATGESYTAKDIHHAFVEKGTTLTLQQIRVRVNFLMHQTRFKWIVDTIKSNRSNLHAIMDVAQDLSADDLYTIVYSKSEKEKYQSLCTLHPAVCAHIKLMEEMEAKEEEEKEEVEEIKEVEVIPEEVEEIVENNPINDTIAKVIAEHTGMVVEVRGKIEVVFKFG